LNPQDVTIKLLTHAFGINDELMNIPRNILNNINGVSVYSGVNDQTNIWFEVKGVFIEIPQE